MPFGKYTQLILKSKYLLVFIVVNIFLGVDCIYSYCIYLISIYLLCIHIYCIGSTFLLFKFGPDLTISIHLSFRDMTSYDQTSYGFLLSQFLLQINVIFAHHWGLCQSHSKLLYHRVNGPQGNGGNLNSDTYSVPQQLCTYVCLCFIDKKRDNKNPFQFLWKQDKSCSSP